MKVLQKGKTTTTSTISMTPEILISCLQFIQNHRGTEILDYYAKKYEISKYYSGFNAHPLFEDLMIFTIDSGNVIESRETKTKENTQVKYRQQNNITDEKLWQILEEIKKKFIGQEEVVEDIFYNIVNNQKMVI